MPLPLFMPLIKLQTFIAADQLTCFNISRSIDIHIQSMEAAREQAIAGRMSGLIELNETVTWKAKHFGTWWKMTVKITSMNPPDSFTDEMISGPFAHMRHTHRFISQGNGTLMIDEFNFASPLGILGKLADHLFVLKYMIQLLTERNRHIKKACEQA
jgi:ligand-binding SRPBCC domain-containing protein